MGYHRELTFLAQILYFNEKVPVIKTKYKFSKFSFITIKSWSLINKKISIKHEREIIIVFLTMTHISLVSCS